jgi:type I restriction enzyme S subunit
MKKGWESRRLGDVCGFDKTQGIHRGLPYVGLEDIESNTGRFIGSLVPVNVKSSTFRFSTEHVLYGRLRPYLNKAIAPDFEGHCSTEIFPIKPSPAVSRDYLLYWLLADETMERINRTCTGARMPRADMHEVLDFDLPLPPLPEQQRIVRVLDEAFAGLATAQANAARNLQNTRAIFESALTAAMNGRLTKEWRKSNPRVETGDALLSRILAKRRCEGSNNGHDPELIPPATNGSASIPASWTWTNLSQLKTFSLYGPRFSNADYSRAGVLVLRTSDIDEHGKVNSETAPKLNMTDQEFEKYRCEKGDLLITRTGSLGTLAVFNDDSKAIPGAYLIQFRLVFLDVIPWFLFAFFKSPVAQARLTSGATGAGIQNLNVPTLEAIPIPLPPLEEQRAIVAQLAALAAETQRLARLYEQKLAALADLKKSLLHQAFSGNL